MVVAHDTGTTESHKNQHHSSDLVITPHSFFGPPAGDSTPAGTGRTDLQGEEEYYVSLHRGSLREESAKSGNHRMPSGLTNGFASCHARSRVRSHWKARFIGIEEHVAVRSSAPAAT